MLKGRMVDGVRKKWGSETVTEQKLYLHCHLDKEFYLNQTLVLGTLDAKNGVRKNRYVIVTITVTEQKRYFHCILNIENRQLSLFIFK